MARSGRGGTHDEPEGCRSRFGLGCLAQQKQRASGIAGAAVQPARRRQVETSGAAAGFEDDSAESIQCGGLLGDPERVGQLVRLGDQKAGGIDAVKETQAWRIGIAGFVEALCRAGPENVRGWLVHRQASERQREGGGRARVAHAGRMDLDKAGTRKAAAQGGVETFGAGDQKAAARHSQPAMPNKVDVIIAAAEPFGEAAFDLRDLMAKGRNRSPSHGMRGHGGTFFTMFLLCSIDSRARLESQANQ